MDGATIDEWRACFFVCFCLNISLTGSRFCRDERQLRSGVVQIRLRQCCDLGWLTTTLVVAENAGKLDDLD
jgi:hypothetical protein